MTSQITKICPDESERCVYATHIYFWHDIEDDRPKTQWWSVLTKDYNELLGSIHWFGRWRCYAFFPKPDLVFEKTCLRDIAFFCERLTKKHKALRNKK